ncbi:MAG: site-2 protease family protein, partial [Planctomycetota bacterium]|nr:site-2 protease family protein [Planctomycetota bacterium]
MSPEILRTLQVALGIGMVIFVHEMGHYLAARFCKVQVEVFSLGFGPKVLGFRRKGTLYQLALIPFGGYVRMKGEYGPEDGSAPDPDSLPSKSVPQRFLIYAGGVIMNVIFALVCFPIVYHYGLPAIAPVVGQTAPGSPAWLERIPLGTKILKVGGRPVYDFMSIPGEVAIHGSNPVRFEMLYPGDTNPREVVLDPVKDETNGFYRVGIAPLGDPDWAVAVHPGGPAYQAGLRDGDRVVEVLGSLKGQSPGVSLSPHFAEGTAMGLRVRRNTPEGADAIVETLQIDPRWQTAESGRKVFGIEPPSHVVHAVRDSEAIRALGLKKGDRIIEAAGRDILRSSDLPLALRSAPNTNLRMLVLREGARLPLNLSTFHQDLAADLLADIALQQDLESTTVLVRPKSAAFEAGLRTGDTILTLWGQEVQGWEDIQNLAASASTQDKPLQFDIRREGTQGPLSFTATASLPTSLDYGFGFRSGTYTFQTDGIGQAVAMGGRSSLRMLREAGMTLRQMFRQEISPKNLGGIVTISKVSYQASSMGWTKLLFFLCMLSVNLAFLNVLPIPLLDGGHLFFVLVEGIKG